MSTVGGEPAPSFGNGLTAEIALSAESSHALFPDDFAILALDVLPDLSTLK